VAESNIAEIKLLYRAALAQVATEYAEAMFDIATEPRFWEGFDKPTVRQNGDTVGNPRDIVDTGEFADGIEANGTTIAFNAPHSGYVINGHRTAKGYVPGRDIVKIAGQKFKQADRLKLIIDGLGE
jgi:hypothetical protein